MVPPFKAVVMLWWEGHTVQGSKVRAMEEVRMVVVLTQPR